LRPLAPTHRANPALQPDPFLSATALASLLQSGRASATGLLESRLDRIARHNPALNAVVTLDAERARALASALDRDGALLQGAPLRGLPATIKDSFETAGLRTTCGAPQWKSHVPQANADAVQRLVDAGTVLIGKTNVPIYAGDIQTSNLLFGATSNPWDRSRTSGGSSGGAAAAVAAGLSTFELGSDIGGSIRIPAHFCGVYGHKPTYGAVPMRGHLPPPPGSCSTPDLGVAGPIARTARDLELLLDVLAGPHAFAPPRGRRLGEFRIAAWLEDAQFPVDDEVRDALERTLASLERAGARVDRHARPVESLERNFDHYLRMLWPVTTAHLTQKAFARMQESGREAAAGSPQRRLAEYSAASHREWLHLQERRARLQEDWRRFFERFDVLLCPVGPVCAFPHDPSDDLIGRNIRINGSERWYWEQLAWISLATLAHLPATAAPAGRSGSGMPAGLQIVGPAGGDRTCIEFAALLADIAGGFEPPPAFRDIP
jgi:amidase